MKTAQTEYFASLSEELRSQAQRVRQLIGSSHWGHDGRHKELLLMDLLHRHCPVTVLVSTGFVVSPHDLEVRSREQDILLVDVSREAPLFQQGSLVIAFPHTVVAAISVKTTMDASTLRDTIDGLQSIRAVSRDAGLSGEHIWTGGFFFQTSETWAKNPRLIYDGLKNGIGSNPAPPLVVDDGKPTVLGPNCVADSAEFALVVDYERPSNSDSARVRGYQCGGVATAIFIALLLQHICFRFGSRHSAFADLINEIGVSPLSPASFPIVP